MEQTDYDNQLLLISYECKKTLIQAVCKDLGKEDSTAELIEKYLTKPKAVKRKVDPNKPKKAPTSYILFCNEQRESVKKSNPDSKMPEILRLLGKQWGALTDKKKEKYVAMAEKAKKAKVEEMAAYEKSLTK